jgi:hypothetical protein
MQHRQHLHLQNIFKAGELDKNSVTEEYSVTVDKNSVTEEYSVTAADGKKYRTNFYSLEAIIAVGYRVNLIIGKPPAMPVDYQCLTFTGVYESPS